jgi:hypothetical protein
MLDARGSQLPTPERVAARAFKAQETPDMQALDYRLRCSLVQVTGCRRGHCAALCCRDTPRESTGQVLRDAAGWAAKSARRLATTSLSSQLSSLGSDRCNVSMPVQLA